MQRISYLGLGHIAMRCLHFEKTLAFYREALGFEILTVLEPEDHSWTLTYLQTRYGQQLELSPKMPLEPDGEPHAGSASGFCVLVESLEESIRKLSNLNIKVRFSSSQCRAPEDSGSLCGGLCAFVHDPEGNEVKLLQFTPQSYQLAAESSNVPVPGLTHISLRCNHFEKTLSFYQDVMQLRVIFSLSEKPGRVYLQIKDYDFIELIDSPYSPDFEPDAVCLRHFCILVENMAQAAQLLHQNGCELLEGGERFLQTDAALLAQELAKPDLCGSLSTGVLDPEGNWVEIMQYTKKSIQLGRA